MRILCGGRVDNLLQTRSRPKNERRSPRRWIIERCMFELHLLEKKSQSNQRSFLSGISVSEIRSHQSSPSRRTIERPGAWRRPEKPSALQGSLEERVRQEQQGQGEIVCHGRMSCCVQMCVPWPRVLAVENSKEDTGYP